MHTAVVVTNVSGTMNDPSHVKALMQRRQTHSFALQTPGVGIFATQYTFLQLLNLDTRSARTLSFSD